MKTGTQSRRLPYGAGGKSQGLHRGPLLSSERKEKEDLEVVWVAIIGDGAEKGLLDYVLSSLRH